MKGKEVLKALEYCINHDECSPDCPCFSERLEMCGDYKGLLKQCLDFIDRLKTERNKYKFKAQAQKGELARLNKQVAEQKAEIDKLNALFDSSQDNAFKVLRLGLDLRKKIRRQKSEIERYKVVIKLLEKDVLTAKTEVIKEFLKRLEDESIESLVCLGYGEKELQNIVEFETVEQIAKEMTEVEK